VPQNEGRAIRQDKFELSVSYLRIQEIEPGRMSLDQDIVVLQHWLRHVAEAQGSFLFVSIDDEGFHDVLFPNFL